MSSNVSRSGVDDRMANVVVGLNLLATNARNRPAQKRTSDPDDLE